MKYIDVKSIENCHVIFNEYTGRWYNSFLHHQIWTRVKMPVVNGTLNEFRHHMRKELL